MAKRFAAALFVALIGTLGLGVVVLSGERLGGSDVGRQDAPGQEELSAALADFEGDPGLAGQTRFDDPFTYCRAVGTIDKPDQRYTGPLRSEELNNRFADAVGIPHDAGIRDDLASAGGMFTWRCAEGQLLVCTYGANIPCDSKANTEEQPAPAMNDWCTNPPPNFDPAMPIIPAFVVGHDTIYSWECHDGVAVAVGEPQGVDEQGYTARFWYPVLP